MNPSVGLLGNIKRPAAHPVRKTHATWWRALLVIFGLYLAGVAILFLTGNPNLFPTVVILGSFMVPITYVAFFYDHRHLSSLPLVSVGLSFFYGGFLGVFLASILEPLLLQSLTFPTTFIVGLVEELVKIVGVVVIARKMRHDSELDGLILGAAAGMGFAALESTGYAFSAFVATGGSLSATLMVTLFRGLLSPLGHGTWTAILTAIIFRESQGSRFRLNLKVLGAYLAVAGLHGLWDGLPILLSTLGVTGLGMIGGQAVVGGLGLVLLGLRWRDARRREASPLDMAIQFEI